MTRDHGISASSPYEAPTASLLERTPADPIELAAQWRTVARRLKLSLWVPVMIGSVVVGLLGALLHIGGYWSVLGTVDGYYIVHNATVGIAFVAPAAALYFPGYAVFRSVLRARRALFIQSTLKQYAVDEEELTLLARALE